MQRTVLCTIAVALLATASASAKPRTIVGEWKMAGKQCSVTNGAIHIGPMSVGMDEYVCSFDDVSRSGNTLTWNGSCQDPYSGPEQTRVVATEKGGKLWITYNGNPDVNGPYERCGG